MRFRKIGKLGGYFGWGDLLEIESSDRDSLLQIVLREIENSIQSVSEGDDGLQVQPDERKRRSRMLRDCDLVSISKTSECELIIQPMMMRPRGGGSGDPKDRIVFALPNTNEKFIKVLEMAYARCAVVYD